ncbi:PspC domain-containing protein [Naumannella halotolerans]|uniref:Phage shock protein PspC (Stress-responsive transcriptional regulator) n=1 Tax=Naumannella halotolerans TaxID=993414 RepID=A0A4R7J9J1_9ACTN|nr:PspC domain-containing protein [Naumannella halotolerans]TDT34202.1 phage shock protein PspC (stress-responsive transcriptional regulator) [Naumannella halotolerans]
MSQPVLRRRRDGGVVAGVCRGVADRYRIDPTLVRLAAVLLALSGGVGLVLYGLGVLLLPREGEQAPVERYLPGASSWPAWVWAIFTVLACIVVAAVLGPVLPFGVMPAVVLAAVWYFGYHRSRHRRTNHRQPLPPPVRIDPPVLPDTEFGRAAAAWRARIAELDRWGGSDTAGAWPSYSPQAAANDPVSDPDRPSPAAGDARFVPIAPPVRQAAATTRARRRTQTTPIGRALRWTGLILAGLALLTLGILNANGLQVPALVWLAAPTAALSLMLVIGAFVGRPRGLGIATVALVIVTSIAALAGQASSIATPYTQLTHSAEAAAPTSRDLDLGTLDVDLTALRTDAPRAYSYSVEAGTLRLHLPEEERNLIVVYRVDAGSVTGPGLTESGVELSGTKTYVTDPSAPQVRVNLTVDVGTVQVIG